MTFDFDFTEGQHPNAQSPTLVANVLVTFHLHVHVGYIDTKSVITTLQYCFCGKLLGNEIKLQCARSGAGEDSVAAPAVVQQRYSVLGLVLVRTV